MHRALSISVSDPACMTWVILERGLSTVFACYRASLSTGKPMWAAGCRRAAHYLTAAQRFSRVRGWLLDVRGSAGEVHLGLG